MSDGVASFKELLQYAVPVPGKDWLMPLSVNGRLSGFEEEGNAEKARMVIKNYFNRYATLMELGSEIYGLERPT